MSKLNERIEQINFITHGKKKGKRKGKKLTF